MFDKSVVERLLIDVPPERMELPVAEELREGVFFA